MVIGAHVRETGIMRDELSGAGRVAMWADRDIGRVVLTAQFVQHKEELLKRVVDCDNRVIGDMDGAAATCHLLILRGE